MITERKGMGLFSHKHGRGGGEFSAYTGPATPELGKYREKAVIILIKSE